MLHDGIVQPTSQSIMQFQLRWATPRTVWTKESLSHVPVPRAWSIWNAVAWWHPTSAPVIEENENAENDGARHVRRLLNRTAAQPGHGSIPRRWPVDSGRTDHDHRTRRIGPLAACVRHRPARRYRAAVHRLAARQRWTKHPRRFLYSAV